MHLLQNQNSYLGLSLAFRGATNHGDAMPQFVGMCIFLGRGLPFTLLAIYLCSPGSRV